MLGNHMGGELERFPSEDQTLQMSFCPNSAPSEVVVFDERYLAMTFWIGVPLVRLLCCILPRDVGTLTSCQLVFFFCGSKPFWDPNLGFRCTTHFRTYSGDWDVHWGYRILTHFHLCPFILWMDNILHHPRHHGKPLLLVFKGYHIILGFLNGGA